jgi:putative ABC transport system substrate-binding protein
MHKRKFLKAAAAGVCLMALGAAPALAEPVKIAIASFGDHPQLNAAVDGFKAELAAEGLKEGTDVTFTFDHVNFDATLVPQMLTKIEGEKPALILAVTTPVAQMAKNALAKSGIPIVFTAVTDPVAAGLVPSWDKGGEGITGASDMQDIDATLTFARKLLPNAKTIGVPYNPGEANDAALVKILQEKAAAQGFAIAEVGVDNANDISQRVASLAGKADVVYVPASNLVQPAVAAVASAALAARMPVINTDERPVKEGIVPASFSVSFEKIGQNAGKLAGRILKGEKPADLAPVKPVYEDHAVTISKKAAAAFGMAIPDSFADCNCIGE